MAELPELGDSVNRKLALQWSTALDQYKLTGERLGWHESAWKRSQRIQAQAPETNRVCPAPTSPTSRAFDDIGIPQSIAVAQRRCDDLAREYFQIWYSSETGYENFVEWLAILKRKILNDLTSVWERGSEIVLVWFQRACLPAVKKGLDRQITQKIRQARDAELKRLERAPRVSVPIQSSVPVTVLRGEPMNSELRSLTVRGPDDAAFLIEPYVDGYVWKIRNEGLKSISEVSVKIVSVQSFDAQKRTFRGPVGSSVQWRIRGLGPGEVTQKSTIFIRIEGDHLELGEISGLHPLSWPSGDSTSVQRWLLDIKIIGLWKERSAKLDVQWTVAPKRSNSVRRRIISTRHIQNASTPGTARM